MFQKVHLQLAALCAGITVFILLVMSCGYLYISEKSLKDSSFTSFQNDMNTVIGNLEQQTVFTHEWLLKMEDHGKYQICILDNNLPFLFNERDTDERKRLFEKAWEQYWKQFPAAAQDSQQETGHAEFKFSDPEQGSRFYASAMMLRHGQAELRVLILMPLYRLESQIQSQRIRFLILDTAAAASLVLFSWYFTKRLLRPLEENQQRQIQFIASASHELRTPLAVILSCVSAAKCAENREKNHFLDSIHAEGLRMSRLIGDLLLLTAADCHTWTIQKASTELDTLLLESYEGFEPMAAEKNIRMSVRLPDEPLPPCSCDRERIAQVLAILLHNAVSYTPEQGEILVSLSLGEKSFQLQVADNGPGISDPEKKHIFERFYRADKAHSKKGHFGLGLCIASEIVKAHRGKISVNDTPGGGSTFTVFLPL